MFSDAISLGPRAQPAGAPAGGTSAAPARTVLDLTESNPTRAGLSYPAGDRGRAGGPARLAYDPQPPDRWRLAKPLPVLRRARTRRRAGRVLLTASTSEAYAYLFKLLADPGDEVLVPRPSYPLFEFLASHGIAARGAYPLVYHGGWSIDCEALAAAVTDRDARHDGGESEQSHGIVPQAGRAAISYRPVPGARAGAHLGRSLRRLRFRRGRRPRAHAGG